MKSDEELRASLTEPHDEARARDNWSAIAQRRRKTSAVPSLASPRLALGLGTLAVAAVVLVLIAPSLFRGAPGPLLRPDGAIAEGVLVPADLPEATLALDDGSRVALASDSRLEVLENAGDHVRFWLHEGAADFDVVPGGPRRWVIESGLVTVEVLGTSFRVARTDTSVEVSVTRGSVLVRGPTAPGGMQRLHAGDRLVLPLGSDTSVGTTANTPPAEEMHASSTDTEPTTASSTTSVDLEASGRSIAPRPERVEPRSEPSTGPTEEPTSATTSTDPEPATVTPPSSAERLREADRLRATGQLDAAIALLTEITDDASAGGDRALAAFTLGRLELDRRGQPREAATAFSRAIELGLRGPLLEDARARRVQALARVDRDAARDAARDYHVHHPDGRWRTEVDAWIDAP